MNICPHCKSAAVIENNACGVCGGPRIPGDHGGENAVLALKEQKRHLSVARLASVSTVVQAVFAAMATLIALVTMPESVVAKAILFIVALVPLVSAMRSRSRASKARTAAAAAGERAWLAATEELAYGGTTAKELAKKLEIEPARAEQLLNASAAQSRVRIDVSDDRPDVVYRTEDLLASDSYPSLEAAKAQAELERAEMAEKNTEKERAR